MVTGQTLVVGDPSALKKCERETWERADPCGLRWEPNPWRRQPKCCTKLRREGAVHPNPSGSGRQHLGHCVVYTFHPMIAVWGVKFVVAIFRITTSSRMGCESFAQNWRPLPGNTLRGLFPEGEG